METLWHEIMHARTAIMVQRIKLGEEPFEEGLVQALSRLSYSDLLSALGGKTAHQQAIITNGYAYPRTAGNIGALISRAELERDVVVGLFLRDKSAGLEPFTELLSRGLGIKQERIKTLYGHATSKPLADFKAKVEVLIRNAPRNKAL